MISNDLGAVFEVSRVRLFYTGSLPGLTVAVSSDGRAYAVVASEGAAETGSHDVADIDLRFDPVSTRYVRVSVGRCPEPGLLTLAELEVWAP